MSALDEFHRRLTASISFPLTNYLYNRKHIGRGSAELARLQWLPPDEIRRWQLAKVRERLAHAAQWVPFYQRRFREIGLDPRDIKSVADLQQIPPLTRQDVVHHRYELIDRRLLASAEVADRRGPAGLSKPVPLAALRRHRLTKESSSGSTGEPLVYYDDGSINAASWAFELFFRSWFAIPPFAREIRMRRAPPGPSSMDWHLPIRKLLWRQVRVPGLNLGPREYEMARRTIEDYRPVSLYGSTSSLVGLAEYMLAEGCKLPRPPQLVITWSERVTPDEVDLLERAFGGEVTNLYGSREIGHLACRCPSGSLHVNQWGVFLEVGSKHPGVEESGAGDLLATPLYESPMPFIRYELGDVGVVGDSDCGCGRRLQVIGNLIGRSYELFETSDGRTISPNFWVSTFRRDHMAGFIKRFQVIYGANDEISIKIVKKEGYPMNTEDALRQLIGRTFGPTTRIDWSYVSEIPPEPSGKIPMVKRERAGSDTGSRRARNDAGTGS
jgi:phenylacetate-CoA ligase